MDNSSALTLPIMPVETLDFAENSDRFLEEARRLHPWLARFSQGYVVHGFKAVVDLLADDAHLKPGIGPFIDFYGVRGTMWARFMEELLTSTTGPTHARLRKSVAHAFTPRHANRMRPLMQDVIVRLLAEWAPKGQFDFAEFASLFPVTVMCGLLGISAEPVGRLRHAIEDHLSSLAMDLATKPRFLKAWDELWAFADALVTEREASGQTDEESLLDALVEVKKSGKMDDTELRFMLLTLFIAGYDTSKNQLSMIMMLLIDRPELYERCARDKEFCGKVVVEALRYSSIATPFREVHTPFTYAGIAFGVGDLLVLAPPLAGRDPAVFADPLTFDPDRENANRHAAFGRGPHICLGQFLAMYQLQEAIHHIAQRMRNPRLDGKIEWRNFLGAGGLRHLPIAFDPA